MIRGYRDKKLVFEDRLDTHDKVENLSSIATAHAKRLMGFRHTIEIEDLDQPDPNKRFLRVGTDPTMMVEPKYVHSGGFLDLSKHPFFRK